MTEKRDISATARCVRALRREIKAFKPDIVHTHLWLADIVAGLALPRSGVRHVSHQHGMNLALADRGPGPAIKRALARHVFAKTRPAFIPVSKAVKEHLQTVLGIEGASCHIVYNGIDIDRDAPPAPFRDARSIMIGAAGRIVPEKGFKQLIDAVAIPARKQIPVELRIAGDGSSLPACKQQTAAAGISDLVHFPGQISDMRSFYRQTDIYVLPSLYTEGLAVSILEAMAAGRPVVATNVGGNPEVVENGETGLLVPPGDVDALAAAIGQLAADPRRAVAMGAAGRERVRTQFTAEQMLDGVGDVYKSLDITT